VSDLFFTGLGGTDEVGASSYLYRLGKHNLLIDAGVRPGGVGEAALPKLDLLSEFPPEAMILTHAHLDHVGALPRVTRLYPKLPIYCTAATARIVTLVLADTIKVSTEQGYALFSDTDMKRALERLRVIPYHQPVTEHGFTFTLRPSGHLLGAASVLIQSGSKRIFHTGDVSNVATPVVDAAWLPTLPEPVDAVISESTYGDTLLPSRKEQVRTFIAAIGETLKGGGKVLIPSFALGRAQEVTQILLGAMNGGQLPRVPIYLDGLTRDLTRLYEEMLPSLPETLRNWTKNSGQPAFLRDTVQLVKDRRERGRIIAAERPGVVIASSGMLHAGASPEYARAWLPEAHNALFVVGYQDAESPGRRLLELQSGGDVLLPNGDGGRSPVSAVCRVERFYLSAHADRSGLLGMIHRYPSGKVILTHGEVSARHNMAGYLNTKLEVALPKAGDMVALEDTGRRRGAFIRANKKQEAIREKHARAKVELHYDPETHQLIIDLPDDLNKSLFGEGSYTLEVLRGKLSKIKLRERDLEAELLTGEASEAAGSDEEETA